jgi:malic enzyme
VSAAHPRHRKPASRLPELAGEYTWVGNAVAVAATGRSDFPNQINNSLAFPRGLPVPGVFRSPGSSGRDPAG